MPPTSRTHIFGPDLPKAIEVAAINANYVKQMHESALYLAENGWTIPMDWTLSQLREIRGGVSNPESADTLLIEWYKSNDYRALKALEERIKQLPDFVEWNQILDESFKGFHFGFRTALVPTLLTILEGVLARKVGTNDIRLKTPTAEMAKNADPSVLHQIVWISLSHFVNRLYEKSDFNSHPAPVLNRHWILHGRDQRAWGDAECLKLFNFFGTLSSV